MKIATITIKSASPYTQSAFYRTPRPPRMDHNEYEDKYAHEKLHVNSDGLVFIPPMALKRSIEEACKRMGRVIPGKGKTQYTKFLVAGTQIVDPPVVQVNGGPLKADKVAYEWLKCDSQGKKGSAGGTMVDRKFPRIDDWHATFELHVFDDVLTKEIIEESVRNAGVFVGLGKFRPENGGWYGRFSVEKVVWEELEV